METTRLNLAYSHGVCNINRKEEMTFGACLPWTQLTYGPWAMAARSFSMTAPLGTPRQAVPRTPFGACLPWMQLTYGLWELAARSFSMTAPPGRPRKAAPRAPFTGCQLWTKAMYGQWNLAARSFSMTAPPGQPRRAATTGTLLGAVCPGRKPCLGRGSWRHDPFL